MGDNLHTWVCKKIIALCLVIQVFNTIPAPFCEQGKHIKKIIHRVIAARKDATEFLAVLCGSNPANPSLQPSL